jgi:hypothetical protein
VNKLSIVRIGEGDMSISEGDRVGQTMPSPSIPGLSPGVDSNSMSVTVLTDLGGVEGQSPMLGGSYESKLVNAMNRGC